MCNSCRLSLFAFSHNFCYQGHESEDYYKVRIKFRGDSFVVGAHQLALWVHTDFDLEVDKTKECSHLCHLPSCTLPSHLTYETAAVNKGRKKCKRQGKCNGHGEGHPDCIV